MSPHETGTALIAASYVCLAGSGVTMVVSFLRWRDWSPAAWSIFGVAAMLYMVGICVLLAV